MANAEFLFNDVQNESLAEQLREKKRYYGENNLDIDFYIVPEPAWLDKYFRDKAKTVNRPCAAIISQDKKWIM